MTIRTIDIRHYNVKGQYFYEEGLTHEKQLPVFSIAQSIFGSYGVKIGEHAPVETHAMGAFIAPSGTWQRIVHHMDASMGAMSAQWAFLDVRINGAYRLDALYAFPVCLPARYQRDVYQILAAVRHGESLCDDLSDLYRLIKILLLIAAPKPQEDLLKHEIVQLVDACYAQPLHAGELAKALSISVPNVYRKFQSYFHMAPSAYINGVRLEQAAILLETTGHPIGQIGQSVGFEDGFYFSRLFKQKYGVSPSAYRARLESQKA